jgi:ADP-heptose:LPS heptosyltransferase
MILLGPYDMELLQFMSGMDERVVIARELPLRVIASLIARMKVLLAGDTSLGHVASAVGIPVITLAGPTQVSITRPWGDENIVIKTEEVLDCMPCYGTSLAGHCVSQNRCMYGISHRRVVEAISKYF